MSGKILLVEDGTKKGRQIWEALKTYGREVLWCSSEPVGPYDPLLGQPMYQIDPERLDRAPEEEDITLINLADIAIAFVEQTSQYDEAELTVEVLTREGIVCVGFSSQGEHNGTLAQAGAPIVRRKEALVSSLKTVMKEANRLVEVNQNDSSGLKALTVYQPSGWAIFHGKDFENRAWPALVRGTIAIHTAAEQPPQAYENFAAFIAAIPNTAKVPPYAELPKGKIIGLVDIVDCADKGESPWFEGTHGFKLANARLLPSPIACKGYRRFWRVSRAIEAKVRQQLA
jgi:hypothetical protein